MENNTPQNEKGLGGTQQLGLSFSTDKGSPQILNNMNLYTPDYDSMSNSIFLGPQGPWLEKMDEFNNDYNTEFKFTKTFRWSPGYKNILHALVLKAMRLDENGKKRAPHLILEAAESNSYYLRRIRERFMRIHNGITDLRRQGLVFVEDPQLVFDKLSTLKDTIAAQVEMMNKFKDMYKTFIHIAPCRRIYDNDYQNSGGYDFIPMNDWDAYIDCTVPDHLNPENAGFYDRFENHYISIYMRMEKFDINVTDINNKSLGSVPGHDIELEFLISIPTLLNKLQGTDLGNITINSRSGYYPGDNDLLYRRGRYWHPLGLSHPYISGSNNQDYWRNVCLGDLESSMRSQAVNLDLVSLMMAFNSWATSFTVGHTHPLNQIHTCHIGMPPQFSESYQQTVGKDTQTCSSQIIRGLRRSGLLEYEDPYNHESSMMHNNVCDEIECAFRDRCDEYKHRQSLLTQEKLEDTLDEKGLDILKQMQNWARTAQGGRNG